MRLPNRISEFYDALLALLYPQGCEVCGGSVEGRSDGLACAACWAETHLFSTDDALCPKCGEFTPGDIPAPGHKPRRCGKCDDTSFDVARACGVYDKALRASVLGLKRKPYVAARLVELMLEIQQREPLNGATQIIAVPLHPTRKRERGFNQAAVLAAELSRRSGLPLIEEALIRTYHSERHRAGMDAVMRRKSVENAFEVRKPRLVDGESILLIDDVLTTGATVSACAKALKNAGAHAVYVLSLARPKVRQRD